MARKLTLVLVPLALLAWFLLGGTIRQDPAYHAFADRRALLGTPNAADVLSNAAFLLAGLGGLAFCALRRPPLAPSWGLFFLGTAFVTAGSVLYHWAPSDATLVWDRLPMTVAFMGLFVALLGEHVDAALQRYLLVPAVVTGLASVAWWQHANDLRLYYWVQFTPLVCIPVLLILYPRRNSHQQWLLYGLACYVAAKAAEAYDEEIFSLTAGSVSGHTLKHLLAAAAVGCVLAMLMRRRADTAGAMPLRELEFRQSMS